MRRKNNDKNIRKISRSGGYSYALTLPMDAMRDFGWREGQKVVVKQDKKRKRLIIEDWR